MGGYEIRIGEEPGVARIGIAPPLQEEHELALIKALRIEDSSLLIQEKTHSEIEIDQIEENPWGHIENERLSIVQDELSIATRIGNILSKNFGVEVKIDPMIHPLSKNKELFAS